VEQAFVDYFQDIFTSSIPQNIDDCIGAINGRLTHSMKERLIATYTKEEVDGAL
jgi:hypothetical protein